MLKNLFTYVYRRLTRGRESNLPAAEAETRPQSSQNVRDFGSKSNSLNELNTLNDHAAVSVADNLADNSTDPTDTVVAIAPAPVINLKLPEDYQEGYREGYLTESQTEPTSPPIVVISNSSVASTISTEVSDRTTTETNIVNVLGYYSITKAGNRAEECEDAYACAQTELTQCFAISDGATESSFSREWAQELVKDFVQRPIWRGVNAESCLSSHGLNNWLAPLQHNWSSWLAGQKLVWFAKRKAEQGTFATLIGLEIAQDRRWQVFAIGDSCLFVTRNGNLLYSFPITTSSELGYRPYLIGTLVQPELSSVARYLTGSAQPGDHFYLVTDALAGWILASLENSRNPWVQLDQIASQGEFSEWVDGWRDRREMQNDDTSMLHIEISA